MKKLNRFLFSEAAAGQGGAASGAGAGAAASGSGAGAGAGAGSGAAAASGGGSGIGNSAGAAAYTGPFYANPEYGFDAETQKFFEGKNYPDVKTALTSLPHADRVARDRNVMVKPDPAKIAEWSGWSDLGWIDNAEKYAAGVTKPEVKDGEQFDERAFNALVKTGHANKMLPSQVAAVAAALHANDVEQTSALRSAGAAANKDLDTKLRGDWGQKYDQNVELAKRAFKHFKVDELTGAEMDQVMTAPRMVQLFHQIGEAMGEGNLVDPAGGGGDLNSKDHPRAIEAELNRLESDPQTMAILNDQRHQLYQETVDRRRGLIERLEKAQKRHGRAA